MTISRRWMLAGFSMLPLQSATSATNLTPRAPTNSFGVLTVNELKSITGMVDGVMCQTKGYYVANDGGHGLYSYSLSSSSAANGGTVIAPKTGVGRWLLLLERAHVDVRQFGAKGDGIFDDAPAIQSAIDYASSAVPKIVELFGTCACAGPIILRNGVKLHGFGGSLKASKPMNTFVKLQSDSALIGVKVDANNLVKTYAVYATDFNNVEINQNEVINWKYGVVVDNTDNALSTNLKILNNRIHSPGDVAIYPIWVNAKVSKMIRSVEVCNNFVKGNPGAYSPQNDKTADQIELHGIVDALVSGNQSVDGGEIGLVVARFSKNVVVANNICTGADGDGLQIGSGSVMLTMSTPSNWEANDTVFAALSGAKGIVEFVKGKDVYLKKVSKSFRLKESVSNGSTNQMVVDITRTENIVVTGNVLYNNGRDVTGSGAVFAAIKIQQADNITLLGNAGYDTGVIKKQQFGLYAANVSNIVESGNDFSRNVDGAFSLNGDYSFSANERPKNK